MFINKKDTHGILLNLEHSVYHRVAMFHTETVYKYSESALTKIIIYIGNPA